jgi:hypothetical protein
MTAGSSRASIPPVALIYDWEIAPLLFVAKYKPDNSELALESVEDKN